MAKEEGVKTVVLGGNKDVQQQYCGTVGGKLRKLHVPLALLRELRLGQSTDFSTIQSEVKVQVSKFFAVSQYQSVTSDNPSRK